MSREELYRRFATKCLQSAQYVLDPREKAYLLGMAEKWRELAQKTHESEITDGAPLGHRLRA